MMKDLHKYPLLGTGLVMMILGAGLGAEEIKPIVSATESESAESLAGQTLLTTTWHQVGPYAKFTPDRQRLGCHSVAFAQIFYYHQLQPSGQVRYECSNGVVVESNLSEHSFDWRLFSDTLAEEGSKEADEVARYCYLISAVMQKDFGTGSYKRRFHAKDIEKHLPCRAKEYLIIGKQDPDRMPKLIIDEIEARRPVYFHWNIGGGVGHSVVIDGYRDRDSQFQVHLNYGVADRSGWFDLSKGIETKDGKIEKIRIFTTIVPKTNPSQP